ncbi:YggS family pyridoxal phosphate-dependent enzyme [Clostridium botulinum]|uniref:YggS family pyridoxal phosphate-dependent enzyme n=1 Tax=Clostridium botulinum TaxID=1491 RepID=UPI0023B8242E|nr:YggS family pyridoxal phosphate-dependent enzyme [Clostridium botulinum]
MVMSIKENVDKIKKSIPEGTTLIAVSKTRSLEELEEVYKCDIRDFGENKVQELIEKIDNFHDDVHWHLIGHLQTNKVKYIVGKVHLIHSLDNIRLLKEIEKRYSMCDKVANVLIQINIGRDPNKSGVLLEDLQDLINECEKCKYVKVKGIMTVIPKGNQDTNREYFKEMKNIYNFLSKNKYENVNMEFISMGMTGDYKIALEEGSNMVRIGEGIFGKRVYNV